jgi:hypothetical protein
MAQGESSGEFVAGFLFGAFVGAVLALLFAPTPGEELRGQLREKGIELKERAAELSGGGQKGGTAHAVRIQARRGRGRGVASPASWQAHIEPT